MESLPRYGCMGILQISTNLNTRSGVQLETARSIYGATAITGGAEQNRKDVDLENARWELIRKYPRWIDDYCPVTDLNESIESDGIDEIPYCIEPKDGGISQEVLDLLEVSSDVVQILFYATISEKDYSIHLSHIIGNDYCKKEVCEL